jgi:hypothetical protein
MSNKEYLKKNGNRFLFLVLLVSGFLLSINSYSTFVKANAEPCNQFPDCACNTTAVDCLKVPVCTNFCIFEGGLCYNGSSFCNLKYCSPYGC